VRLADFRGRSTLLLFWDPDCSFCRELLPALRAWESEPSPDGPRLLVISTGVTRADAAPGLRAPVLYDPEASVMSSFAAGGTPIAVLVDVAGLIASDQLMGGPAVLAGLRPEPSYRFAQRGQLVPHRD
jgi:hypothetical protein